MTSFTSGSETGDRPDSVATAKKHTVAGAVVGVLIFAIGMWMIVGFDSGAKVAQHQSVPNQQNLNMDEQQRIQDNLSISTKVIILGNSVAETSLDHTALAETVNHPPQSVSNLAISGGQPAHWLAVLKHQVYAKGLAPDVVVIYAPLKMLNQTRLVAGADRNLMLDLTPQTDTALLKKALGGVGLIDKVKLARARLREEALTRLSHMPIDLLYGPGAASYANMGQGAPRDPTVRWGLVEEDDQENQTPSTEPLADSFFPELIQVTRKGSTRLVLVQPATRPGQRGTCGELDDTLTTLQAALPETGIDLIDLRWAPIDNRRFTRTHHLDHQGRLAASKSLGEALMEMDTFRTSDSAATRLWSSPCSATR